MNHYYEQFCQIAKDFGLDISAYYLCTLPVIHPSDCELTPELLDKIVDEVIPEFYNCVELNIKTYKEKQKLKAMEDDF